MRCEFGNSRLLRIALAAAGTLIVNGAVGAAEAEDEVVVQSTPNTLIHGSPYTGTQVVSITRHVSYADLDLVTHAGVQALETRITETAVAICAKLDRMYPVDGYDRPQCVRQAVRNAMAQARTAIAAADRKMRTARIDTND
jgi:UrcA family protein